MLDLTRTWELTGDGFDLDPALRCGCWLLEVEEPDRFARISPSPTLSGVGWLQRVQSTPSASSFRSENRPGMMGSQKVTMR